MTKVLTEPRSIRIKGRSFLAVVLTPDPPFDDWLVRLDDLAARSAGFFLGRPVVLDVSEIEIDKPQLKALIAELGLSTTPTHTSGRNLFWLNGRMRSSPSWLPPIPPLAMADAGQAMLRLDASETVTPEVDAEPWIARFAAALTA